MAWSRLSAHGFTNGGQLRDVAIYLCSLSWGLPSAYIIQHLSQILLNSGFFSVWPASPSQHVAKFITASYIITLWSDGEYGDTNIKIALHMLGLMGKTRRSFDGQFESIVLCKIIVRHNIGVRL